jgi:hypothetical protein
MKPLKSILLSSRETNSFNCGDSVDDEELTKKKVIKGDKVRRAVRKEVIDTDDRLRMNQFQDKAPRILT